MIRAFTLLLPVLVPSWRFFATVAPSPRIEYAILTSTSEEPSDWREYRPRPQCLSAASTLARLFFNAEWNETLFLISSAERYLQDESVRHHNYIAEHIRDALQQTPDCPGNGAQFCFRLLLTHRTNENILREEVHRSPIYAIRAPGDDQ